MAKKKDAEGKETPVHNFTKQNLVLPCLGDDKRHIVLGRGQTISLSAEQVVACEQDPGFRHWAEHGAVGSPREGFAPPPAEAATADEGAEAEARDEPPA